MATARQIVELGRRVRAETKMRTRQPLAEAVVHVSGHDPGVEAAAADRRRGAERARRCGSRRPPTRSARWRAKPDFKALGPRLGPRVKEVAAALADDDGTLAETPRGRPPGRRSTLDGGAVEIGHDDVELDARCARGMGRGIDGGVTVALELELTPELRREGLARELVRVVQDARKAAGLDVQRPDRAAASSRPASSPRRGTHTRRSSRARRWRPSCGPILQRTRTRRRRPRSTGCPSRSPCVRRREPTSGLRPRRASSARGRRRRGSSIPTRRGGGLRDLDHDGLVAGSLVLGAATSVTASPARCSVSSGGSGSRVIGVVACDGLRGDRLGGRAARSAPAAVVFLAIALTDSAWPWTSPARLCRKARSWWRNASTRDGRRPRSDDGRAWRRRVRLGDDPRRLLAGALQDLVRLPVHLVEVRRADDRRAARAQPLVLGDERLGRVGQPVEELVDVAHPVARRSARRRTPAAGCPPARSRRRSAPVSRVSFVSLMELPPALSRTQARSTKMMTNATSTERSNMPAGGTIRRSGLIATSVTSVSRS